VTDLDGHEDAPVFQGTLRGGVPPPPRFDLGLLDGVDLSEPLQVPLLPPMSAIVVLANRPTGRVDDHRRAPAGEFDEQPGDALAEQPGGALDGFFEGESTAGGGDGQWIMHIGLDLNDV
jgi:hypothetical protein